MKNNTKQINVVLDAERLSTLRPLRLIVSLLSKPAIYAVASKSFYDGGDGCSFIIDAHGDEPECHVFIDYESFYGMVYSLPCHLISKLRKELRLSGFWDVQDPLYPHESSTSWVAPEKFQRLLNTYPQHAPEFVGDFDIATVLKFVKFYGLPDWYFKDKISEPLFAILVMSAVLCDIGRLSFLAYTDLASNESVLRLSHAFKIARSVDVMWESGGWRQCKASREADLNSVLSRALSDRLNTLLNPLFAVPLHGCVAYAIESYLSLHGSQGTRLVSERRECAYVCATTFALMLLWLFELKVVAPVGAVLGMIDEDK